MKEWRTSYAVEVTKTPGVFVKAMEKFARVDPYNVLPNWFDALGYFSHPCITKRLHHVQAALERPAGEPPAAHRRREMRIFRNRRTAVREA